MQQKLEYQCKIYGIDMVEQEESYTSKASFWDKDEIPVYGDSKQHIFSGKRIKRGLYKTSSGILLNADVNGALNILRKSNVVSLNGLYSRGELNTPVRIRVIKTKLLTNPLALAMGRFRSMQTLGDVSTCPFCGSKSLERLHCVAPRFNRAWKKGVNYDRGVDDTFTIRKCPECGFYTVIWSYKK